MIYGWIALLQAVHLTRLRVAMRAEQIVVKNNSQPG